MKLCFALLVFCAGVALSTAGHAASTLPAFYGDPPDEHHPWAVHDPNRPQPKEVTPGTFSSQEQPGQPPSDAIVLFDGRHNLTYADGHAASVYGVNPPMVNALRPPGEFQVYDIIFRRPIYKDGKALDPGYVTVFVNDLVNV